MALDAGTALPRSGASVVRIADRGAAFGWSPDGQSLVYVERGRRTIREVGADGHGDRALVGDGFGECDYSAPAVSPDGRWLLFLRCSSSKGRTGQLFLARRDGTGARRIGRADRPLWLAAGAPRSPLDRPCPG